MIKTILFVSHHKRQCGVYEFGKNIYNAIAGSAKYKIIWEECGSMAELDNAVSQYRPDAILFNFHPSTMPWLCTKVAPKLYRNHVAGKDTLQIGVIHEITQHLADTATSYRKPLVVGGPSKHPNLLFDYYVGADPTLLLRNPFVYKTGRLIPAYQNNYPLPSIPTIGSFGFGTPKKGFEKIVTKVQEEFDEAVIRLNIPAADFGDPDASNAKRIAAACKELLHKKGISLQVTHNFLDDKGVLDFLAQNSINVFLYEDTAGRGISSAIDFALAVKRPIAVSNSSMFRHLLQEVPSACIPNNSLRTILDRGYTPFQQLPLEWNAENIRWEYERILDAAFRKYKHTQKPKMGIIRTIQSVWRRAFSLPDKSFTWLRNTDAASDDRLVIDTSIQYQPVVLTKNDPLNRILDNKARELYKPAIDKLFTLVPKTMAKKIPEANVQQAFIFDTVCRYLPNYHQPKLLCVGSYEDTASMGLVRMGWQVEEIDPMINYFLQEYISKPTTKLNSYNIIFSTSVIEHDPDDESFVRCINDLLAPGGVAIITCDYKDGWKPGDLKPEVDERFYTQEDLRVRLLKHMPGCRLVDEPDWDCPNPDFLFLGKYRYTFASFVVQKNP